MTSLYKPRALITSADLLKVAIALLGISFVGVVAINAINRQPVELKPIDAAFTRFYLNSHARYQQRIAEEQSRQQQELQQQQSEQYQAQLPQQQPEIPNLGQPKQSTKIVRVFQKQATPCKESVLGNHIDGYGWYNCLVTQDVR